MLIRNIYYFYLAFEKKAKEEHTFHHRPSPSLICNHMLLHEPPLPPLVHTYYVNGPLQWLISLVEFGLTLHLIDLCQGFAEFHKILKNHVMYFVQVKNITC